MTPIKNIREITEPLKEQILKGDVHTIDDMRALLKPLGYSDTINEVAVSFILREFVMSKVSSDSGDMNLSPVTSVPCHISGNTSRVGELLDRLKNDWAFRGRGKTGLVKYNKGWKEELEQDVII